jgi:hypothetical protein
MQRETVEEARYDFEEDIARVAPDGDRLRGWMTGRRRMNNITFTPGEVSCYYEVARPQRTPPDAKPAPAATGAETAQSA